jgi:hypothetical protein
MIFTFPKCLMFVTFSADLLPVFILRFCYAFWWRDTSIFLILSLFISVPCKMFPRVYEISQTFQLSYGLIFVGHSLFYDTVLTADLKWSRLNKWKVKVKLSPCLTKYHGVKTYWGSVSITPRIRNLGTGWRWVVSFAPRLICPQGKSP